MKARSLSDVRTDKKDISPCKSKSRRSFPPSFFILLLHHLLPPTTLLSFYTLQSPPQYKWLPLTFFDFALEQAVFLDTASSSYSQPSSSAALPTALGGNSQ